MQAIHQAVYGDPDVCRFYCGETRSLEETRDWLHYRAFQSRESQWGLMAVVVKETATLVGLVGLQPYAGLWLSLEGEPASPYCPLEAELTYAFGRAYWGQGYAFEACQAMVGYAFSDLRLKRLVTGCHPDNVRAARLQERLGMRRVRNLNPKWPGTEGILDNDCS